MAKEEACIAKGHVWQKGVYDKRDISSKGGACMEKRGCQRRACVVGRHVWLGTYMAGGVFGKGEAFS